MQIAKYFRKGRIIHTPRDAEIAWAAADVAWDEVARATKAALAATRIAARNTWDVDVVGTAAGAALVAIQTAGTALANTRIAGAAAQATLAAEIEKYS